MPIADTPYTDPDTLLALYTQPDDEVLQAEIALLSGQTQRDAVNAAIAQTSASASATTGGTAATGGGGFGRHSKISNPDELPSFPGNIEL